MPRLSRNDFSVVFEAEGKSAVRRSDTHNRIAGLLDDENIPQGAEIGGQRVQFVKIGVQAVNLALKIFDLGFVVCARNQCKRARNQDWYYYSFHIY